MSYRLQHHGLITCPFEWDRKPVICWVRLFQDLDAEPSGVAVVTEVPGNPGGSIANEHSTIQAALVDQFGAQLDSLALFQVWPKGCFGEEASWAKIDRAGFAEAPDTSRAEVERLVGQDLPDLPEHDELYRQVLELGGGVWDEAFRRVFEAFPVEELPHPHNPSACAHHERFERIRAGMPDTDDWRGRNLEAGRLFLESLTTDDLAGCRYHRHDWRAIADESVRILDACGDRADSDEYLDAVRRSPLADIEKRWLRSLFGDPVFIGGGSYTNGQHRGCALRFSGAERAAIHTSDESLGMLCIDWVYGGDG